MMLKRQNTWRLWLELCKTSFVDTFLNEYGYLFDYVDGNMMDWSVRPNMIFAVALDYSPLTRIRRKRYWMYVPGTIDTKGLRSRLQRVVAIIQYT